MTKITKKNQNVKYIQSLAASVGRSPLNITAFFIYSLYSGCHISRRLWPIGFELDRILNHNPIWNSTVWSRTSFYNLLKLNSRPTVSLLNIDHYYGPLYGPLYMEPVGYRLSYSPKISYHVDMNSDIQCLISFALISIDCFRYFLYNDSNRGFVHWPYSLALIYLTI